MALPVVVGVDGSLSALDAVRLAAQEAAWRDTSLRIVHAFIWPLMRVGVHVSEDPQHLGGLENVALRMLAEAQAEAESQCPGLPVRTELVTGAATAVLLRQTRAAQLLVLGDRGLGGFTGLLVGSVAVQVAAHAAIPVLVARTGPRYDGPVVVGVDGAGSAAALAEAFAEAEWRGTSLTAIRAWAHTVPTGIAGTLPPAHDVSEPRDRAVHELAEALAPWQAKYPQVPTHHHVVRTSAAKALIDASREAQLVVVGARGRGGFTGLLLGSVSQQVLHHCGSPVMICHAPEL